MSNTSSNFEMAGVLLGKEVRKRKTPQEKIAIIQQTMEPGMTVSHVARLHGIQPSLLFKWKKQYQVSTTEKWFFRNLGGDFHASGLMTLCLSSSNPARPYIWRFNIFRRFT